MNYLIMLCVLLFSSSLFLLLELIESKNMIRILENDNNRISDRLREEMMTDAEKKKRYVEDSQSNEFDQDK